MAGFQLNRRISKQDLFACLCIWMEESPLASTQVRNLLFTETKKTINPEGEDHEEEITLPFKHKERTNKAGAVVIDQNNRIIALDCSREGLHAVVNALVTHPHKVRGGVVYVSRKPCSICMKYMVQMDVNRVYYLPFEPEVPTPEDLSQCDQLCRVCPIAQSIYIPSVSKSTLEESSLRRSPYTPTKGCHKEYTQYLLDRYWNETWLEKMPTLWPGVIEINDMVNQQMFNMFELLAKVTNVDVPQGTSFHSYGSPNGIVSGNSSDEILNENNPKWQEFACHMSRLAHILSQRSDDPTRGVGAVITKNHDIIAVGWNGFPSQAMYGDFPRAADTDTHAKDKKYPFSIHAEQSAILTRFVDDIKDKTTTLFVSKMPCDECVPVISRVGIKNVVFPPPRPKNHSTFLQYGLLEMFNTAGRFKCYISTRSSSNTAVRNLVSNGSL